MNRPTFALLLLVFASPLPADDGPWLVPTEDCRGFWFVPVALSEEKFGPGKVLQFVYDTGAETTIVDAAALERATGRPFENGDRVRIVDATAGPVTFNKLPARVHDLGHLSMAMGRPVDGILAVDAFRKFLVTLDPRDRSMTLRRGRLKRPDGDTVFSVRGPDKRPWLKVSIAGDRERLLVDSGAAGTGISVNEIERFPLQGEPRIFSSSVRLRRIEKRPAGRLDGSVTLAGVTFVEPVIEEASGTQLLGGVFLEHFVMTLDQRSRRLALERTGDERQPPRPQFELGMAYRPNDRGLEVLEVYDDTPAAAAGVEPGDVVVAIDGARPDRRGCAPLTEENREVVFSIERGGTVLDTTLVMLPVIP